MATNLKVGDVVKLRSGGPRMTVERLAGAVPEAAIRDGVHCKWFEGNKLQHDLFEAASLMLADDERRPDLSFRS